MSYLLDTCVVSYLRGEVSQEVVDWFSHKNQASFFLSVVTLAEIEDGIGRLKPSRKKNDLIDWLYGALQQQFQDRILSIDAVVAKTWGQLNSKLVSSGLTLGVQDLYIAATAIVHGLAVVTANTKDFVQAGVVVFNPWDK